jgi:hypothetical protein
VVAWPAREEPRVVGFGDRLLLLGGQDLADVWRSEDGVAWTRLSDEAEYGKRSDFGIAIFGGRIWVYGGWRTRSTDAVNDIWYSDDGARWTRQTASAPWAPRSPRTVVFKDRVWIYSGKHTGGDDNWAGDVWTMALEPASNQP